MFSQALLLLSLCLFLVEQMLPSVDGSTLSISLQIQSTRQHPIWINSIMEALINESLFFGSDSSTIRSRSDAIASLVFMHRCTLAMTNSHFKFIILFYSLN